DGEAEDDAAVAEGAEEVAAGVVDADAAEVAHEDASAPVEGEAHGRAEVAGVLASPPEAVGEPAARVQPVDLGAGAVGDVHLARAGYGHAVERGGVNGLAEVDAPERGAVAAE